MLKGQYYRSKFTVTGRESVAQWLLLPRMRISYLLLFCCYYYSYYYYYYYYYYRHHRRRLVVTDVAVRNVIWRTWCGSIQSEESSHREAMHATHSRSAACLPAHSVAVVNAVCVRLSVALQPGLLSAISSS